MYKKITAIFIALLLVLASMLVFTSCESEQGEAGGAQQSGQTQTEDGSGGQDAVGTESGSGTAAKATVKENGSYDSKEEVAEYLSIYKKLPKNYITKAEARKLGWEGGSVERVAPGRTIGGDRYHNYEKQLPNKKNRKYYECDIDTLGKGKRGPKRIIYSDDGLIYYTGNHYKSFKKMQQSA